MEIPILLVKITLISWVVLPLISFASFKWGKKMNSWTRAEKAQTKAQKSRNRSLSTRYGQITEQFFPFMPCYPYDSKEFRMLGSPIDGVQFEDDKVILIEFKTAGSGLSKRQRKIKKLIDRGKVSFEVHRAS